MPHLCWMCPDGTLQGRPDMRVAGCIERLVMYSPFVGPMTNQAGQPVMNPRTGQQMLAPDVRSAWKWLVTVWLPTSGYQFPPGVAFQCTVTNPARGQDRSPSVYCVQETKPLVVREQVSAPYAQPVGNRAQDVVPLPVSGEKRTMANPAGSLEPIADAALPSNSDPMMGDIDAQGGTYTDIDSMGNEVPREMLRGVPPRPMPGGPR